MERERADLDIELLRRIELEEEQKEKERIEERLREVYRKELPPRYSIKCLKTQHYGILGKDVETVLHLECDVARFFRFIQMMRLIDDPDYIRALAELPEVSDAATIFINKELSYYQLITNYSIQLIEAALKKTNGNKSAASKLLQLNRTTLQEIVKKYGIETAPETISIAPDLAANEG